MLDGSRAGVYPSVSRLTLLSFGIATTLPLLPDWSRVATWDRASFAALALWFVAMHEVARAEKSDARDPPTLLAESPRLG